MSNAGRLARDRCACRIFCRLVEHSSHHPTTVALLDKLLREVRDLCVHTFARHVIETIIENGSPQHKHVIANCLCNHLRHFIKNHNASYILEKALVYLHPDDQDKLLAELSNGDARTITALSQSRLGPKLAK